MLTAQLINFSKDRSGAAELEQKMLAMVVNFYIVNIIFAVVNIIGDSSSPGGEHVGHCHEVLLCRFTFCKKSGTRGTP